MAGLQAGMEAATTAGNYAAQKAVEAKANLEERLQTLQEGKKLLDEGGPAMEGRIRGKRTAIDAVHADRSVLVSLSSLINMYSEALDGLQRMKDVQDPNLISADERMNFETLEQDIAARTGKLQAAYELLANTTMPYIPNHTPQETDAMTILELTGKYKWAKDQTADGLELLVNQAEASGMPAKIRGKAGGSTTSK